MPGHPDPRHVLAYLPTYLHRDGTFMCTLCAALVGSWPADQVKHTAWHTILAGTPLPSETQPDGDEHPLADEPEPSVGSSNDS